MTNLGSIKSTASSFIPALNPCFGISCKETECAGECSKNEEIVPFTTEIMDLYLQKSENLVKEFDWSSSRLCVLQIVEPFEPSRVSSGRGEFDVVNLAEAHWEYARRGSVVTEPVTAVLSRRSVNAYHQVMILEHLWIQAESMGDTRRHKRKFKLLACSHNSKKTFVTVTITKCWL